MKPVLFIALVAIAASALELKGTVKLPPVDGSTWNGSVWVVK